MWHRQCDTDIVTKTAPASYPETKKENVGPKEICSFCNSEKKLQFVGFPHFPLIFDRPGVAGAVLQTAS